MNDIFDVLRFELVLRREIKVNIRNYLGIAAFIFGLYFLIYLIAFFTGNPPGPDFDRGFFSSFLIIGGSIFTSLAFNELKAPVGYFYLTFPASMPEKYLSKWIITSLGWTITYIVSYYIFFFIEHMLFRIILGKDLALINILDRGQMIIIGIFLFIHSVYLLGAAIFKQNAFIKMTISITVISLLIALAFGLTLYLMDKTSEVHLSGNHLEPHEMEIFGDITKYTMIVLTPILWVIAYLRLKETEL